MPSLDQKLSFTGQSHSPAQTQVQRPAAKSTLASWLPTTKSALLAGGALTGLGALYLKYFQNPTPIPPNTFTPTNPDLSPFSNATSSSSSFGTFGNILLAVVIGTSILCCARRNRRNRIQEKHDNLKAAFFGGFNPGSSDFKTGSFKLESVNEKALPKEFLEVFYQKDLNNGKISEENVIQLNNYIKEEENIETKCLMLSMVGQYLSTPNLLLNEHYLLSESLFSFIKTQLEQQMDNDDFANLLNQAFDGLIKCNWGEALNLAIGCFIAKNHLNSQDPNKETKTLEALDIIVKKCLRYPDSKIKIDFACACIEQAYRCGWKTEQDEITKYFIKNSGDENVLKFLEEVMKTDYLRETLVEKLFDSTGNCILSVNVREQFLPPLEKINPKMYSDFIKILNEETSETEELETEDSYELGEKDVHREKENKFESLERVDIDFSDDEDNSSSRKCKCFCITS